MPPVRTRFYAHVGHRTESDDESSEDITLGELVRLAENQKRRRLPAPAPYTPELYEPVYQYHLLSILDFEDTVAVLGANRRLRQVGLTTEFWVIWASQQSGPPNDLVDRLFGSFISKLKTDSTSEFASVSLIAFRFLLLALRAMSSKYATTLSRMYPRTVSYLVVLFGAHLRAVQLPVAYWDALYDPVHGVELHHYVGRLMSSMFDRRNAAEYENKLVDLLTRGASWEHSSDDMTVHARYDGYVSTTNVFGVIMNHYAFPNTCYVPLAPINSLTRVLGAAMDYIVQIDDDSRRALAAQNLAVGEDSFVGALWNVYYNYDCNNNGFKEYMRQIIRCIASWNDAVAGQIGRQQMFSKFRWSFDDKEYWYGNSSWTYEERFG